MKQKLTKLLCSVFLVAFAIPAIAQSSGGSSTRTITGKVTDSEGAPIVGAVVMASQREATTTNSEGRYTLTVQSPDAVLRFSCMGYRPRSENTAGRTVVDVSLETDNQLLEDVVVVGYGVQKKVNLTGSVASIDFSKTSESRFDHQHLGGAGGPGGRYERHAKFRPAGFGQCDDPYPRRRLVHLRRQRPAGARGRRGVEHGQREPERHRVDLGAQGRRLGLDLRNARRQRRHPHHHEKRLVRESPDQLLLQRASCKCPTTTCTSFRITPGTWSLSTSRATTSGPRASSPSRTSTSGGRSRPIPTGVGENGVPNFALYPNTDWFDEIFENGYSQEHNLSISGGSEKIRYLLSLGYLDNQGVMGRFGIDSSTQKVNFRTNLEADVTKWFTAGVRLFGQRQEYGLANISGAFNALYQTTPGVYRFRQRLGPVLPWPPRSPRTPTTSSGNDVRLGAQQLAIRN